MMSRDRRKTAFRFNRLMGLIGAVVVAAAGMPGAQSPPSQTRPLTFRAESNYVEVAAYVTDGAGRFVGGLGAEEFEVLEDGRPQKVTAFSRVSIPIAPPAAPTAFTAASEEGRASNERQLTGRAFAILVDSLHVAPQQTVLTKRILRQFVNENMGTDDQAAIVHIGRPNLSQDFTSDKTRLLASIDGVMGDRIRSRILTKWDSKLRRDRDARDTLAEDRSARARQSLDALRRLVVYLAGMRGQRTAVLYVSEGLDMDLNDRIGRYPSKQMDAVGLSGNEDQVFQNSGLEAAYASAVADDLRMTLEAATRANVAIYTVDPRGLADASEETIGLVGTLGEAERGSPADSLLPTTSLRREFYDSQHYLRSIAEQTGGRAIVSTNNFGGGFNKIIDDSSAYYVLGYQAPRRTDGKFHRITVRTKTPGLSVRARSGYFAARDASASAANTLDVLQSSPMAIPGLKMRAASAVLPAADRTGVVRFVVEIDGQDLAFTERDGKFLDKVDLAYTVIDAEGHVERRATKTLTLALSDATRAAATAHGLRYAAELRLPAGRYQIRLAAAEANAQKHGSIFWSVDVPNYSKAGLTMSPVAVASAFTDKAPTISDSAAVPALVPGLMTATRTFDRADTLSVATVVQGPVPAARDLTWRVIDEAGAEVFRSVEPEARAVDSESSRYVTRIPLDRLGSGQFQLIAEARSTSPDHRAQRTVIFSIR